MYENVYGKTPPRFGENAVTLPLDVNRPCFSTIWATIKYDICYFLYGVSAVQEVC